MGKRIVARDVAVAMGIDVAKGSLAVTVLSAEGELKQAAASCKACEGDTVVLGTEPSVDQGQYEVVYKARSGGQSEAALRVLRRAGCAPIVLGNPTTFNPRHQVMIYVLIAVPRCELNVAAEALIAWEQENNARAGQFEARLKAWFRSAARAALISGIPPLLMLAVVVILFSAIPVWAVWLCSLFWAAGFVVLMKGPEHGPKRWLALLSVWLGLPVVTPTPLAPQAPPAHPQKKREKPRRRKARSRRR
jgi:hypothetical protein